MRLCIFGEIEIDGESLHGVSRVGCCERDSVEIAEGFVADSEEGEEEIDLLDCKGGGLVEVVEGDADDDGDREEKEGHVQQSLIVVELLVVFHLMQEELIVALYQNIFRQGQTCQPHLFEELVVASCSLLDESEFDPTAGSHLLAEPPLQEKHQHQPVESHQTVANLLHEQQDHCCH